MKQLKGLDISNTDINEVDIDKLPNSLENIYYEKRPVSEFYGQCQKCQQLNTSKN